MSFYGSLIDVGTKINKRIQKEEKWYADIIATFEERKNILNAREECIENTYHMVKANNIEYLIYVSNFKNKYIEVRLYSQNNDLFDIKFDCRVDKYMLVFDELIVANIDNATLLPIEIIDKVFYYIEENIASLKLTSMKINHSSFRKPFNEIIKKLALDRNFKEINRVQESYLYKMYK